MYKHEYETMTDSSTSHDESEINETLKRLESFRSLRLEQEPSK